MYADIIQFFLFWFKESSFFVILYSYYNTHTQTHSRKLELNFTVKLVREMFGIAGDENETKSFGLCKRCFFFPFSFFFSMSSLQFQKACCFIWKRKLNWHKELYTYLKKNHLILEKLKVIKKCFETDKKIFVKKKKNQC